MDKPINMVEFATRLCTGPGAVDKADHAATRPIGPYDGLAWSTALAIVRARVDSLRRLDAAHLRGGYAGGDQLRLLVPVEHDGGGA